MVYDYNGNGVDSKGRLERKKSTGRLSSAIGPWGLGANLGLAKNKNHQIAKSWRQSSVQGPGFGPQYILSGRREVAISKDGLGQGVVRCEVRSRVRGQKERDWSVP